MGPGASGMRSRAPGRGRGGRQGWIRCGAPAAQRGERGLRARNNQLRPPAAARGHLTLSFSNLCPFTVMRLRDLPNPQIYTRQERYRARPPRVLEASGFHTRNSLAVYQGLVYYLLWLHSKYYKVGVRRPVGPGRSRRDGGGLESPRGWKNGRGGWNRAALPWRV